MTGAPGTRRFEGRVALVTGAAKGIGLAISRRLMAEGARILVFDSDGEALAEVQRTLARDGDVRAVAGDTAVRADVAAAAAEAVTRFGGLNVVVANAGIGAVAPFLEIGEAAWRRMIDVNLTGAFHTTQEGARAIVASGGGAIVVTASTNAFFPERNTAHYSAAKGGVVALVRAAAIDLAASGVRVNAVSPGIIRTPLAAPLTEDAAAARAYLRDVPMSRFGDADEIADTVLYLASNESSYITGQNIVVDGGTTLGTTFELPEIGATPAEPQG
jgi:3-oxoacyl-[acyl-carrier protein] reductase